jgi:hypothetical protein
MNTQAILEAHRKIRRAVQAPLNAQALAAGLVTPAGNAAIQWRGIPFDRGGLDRYISVEVGFDDLVVHEMGPNANMEGVGHLTLNLHSPIDKGEDGNDSLLPIIVAAYPYGVPVSFEGIDVHVDTAQHRGYGSDGPWLTGLVSVHWNIYRRS